MIDRPPTQKSEDKGKSTKKASLTTQDTAALAASMNQLSVEPSSSTSAPEEATTSPTTMEKKPPVAADLPTLIAAPAKLHLWKREGGFFVHQDDVIAQIVQMPNAGPYDYWLLATAEDARRVLVHKVSSDMNERWSTKLSSMTWNHLSDSGYQSSWCLVFSGPEEFEQFKYAFTRALWETANEYSWEKAKVLLYCLCPSVNLTHSPTRRRSKITL